MNTNTTVPSREPKKRGRPKGSKNKKKTKRQKQIEAVAAVNDDFERAFQNVPAIDNFGRIKERTDDNVNDNSNDDNDKLEETETFGTNLLPVGLVDHDEDVLAIDEKGKDNSDGACHTSGMVG